MAYFTVAEAVETYTTKYETLTTAIIRAQCMRATSRTKQRFDFWDQVVTILKSKKPKKKNKWEKE